MKTITGTVEFNGEEYDYSAQIGVRGKDYLPDRVTDIDCAGGGAVPDDVDFETLEELAMDNALLLDWCEQEGWETEDTGGECSAFIRAPGGVVQRITKAGDPSLPQTMKEPVAVRLYNLNDELIGEVQLFQGGIDEWILSGGYEKRVPLTEPEPVLKEGVIYSADNGMLICRKCAGQCALYTGRDISGQEVVPVPRSENAAWRKMFGENIACESGCTRYDDEL